MRRTLIRALTAVGFAAGLLTAAAHAGSGPNLVVNGSFDSGASGFTSSYTESTNLGNPGTFGVGTDSHVLNGYWASYHDHTTGHGSMLLVNGSTTAGGTVWSEQIPVAPGTTYAFAGWAMSLFQPPAELSFVVGGKIVGRATTPAANGTWSRFSFDWSSAGATQATIAIADESTSFGGNDLALDDLSFEAAGAAAGGTPRVSTLATSVATPSKALSSGKRTLENLAIAAALALFITFPAQLFNHTFDENYAEIREWWERRFGWLEKLRRLISGGEGESGEETAANESEADDEVRGNTLRDSLAALLVVLVGGVLGGMLAPHFGLTRASALTHASVVAATVFDLLAALVGLEYRGRRRRRLGTVFHLLALPAGLLIAAVCVLVSRVASFEPGYLYGLVCGVAFAGKLEKREEGHTAALVLATIAVALAAWGLLVPLGRLASHRHEAWPIVIAADFAGALFTGGIVGSVIGAFPLKFLAGGKVAAWHRGAWAALFALAGFLFLELILNPGKGGHKGHAPLLTVLVLLAVFGVGSVWFYLHFARKEKAKEADAEPEPAPAPAGEAAAP